MCFVLWAAWSLSECFLNWRVVNKICSLCCLWSMKVKAGIHGKLTDHSGKNCSVIQA